MVQNILISLLIYRIKDCLKKHQLEIQYVNSFYEKMAYYLHLKEQYYTNIVLEHFIFIFLFGCFLIIKFDLFPHFIVLSQQIQDKSFFS